jgi:hypothetical protein
MTQCSGIRMWNFLHTSAMIIPQWFCIL